LLQQHTYWHYSLVPVELNSYIHTKSQYSFELLHCESILVKGQNKLNKD
jgi:hypothetical protein